MDQKQECMKKKNKIHFCVKFNPVYLLALLIFFLSGESKSSEFYKAESFFPPVYKDFLDMLKQQDLPSAQLFIEQNKLNLNEEFKISLNVKLEEFGILSTLIARTFLAIVGGQGLFPKEVNF